MSCLRYDPTTRTFYPIKPSQLTKRDDGRKLSFSEQVMRGYQRVEAKGGRINGRAAGIKKIWSN